MEMFDNQLWTKDKTELQHMHASYIAKGKVPFPHPHQCNPQQPAGPGCSKEGQLYPTDKSLSSGYILEKPIVLFSG